MQMLPNDFRDALRANLLTVMWRQWSALGLATHSAVEDRHPVDMEALLVASAVLSSHDQRLTKLAEEWLCLNRTLVLKARVIRMCQVLEQLAGKHHIDVAPLDPEQVIGSEKADSTGSKRAISPGPSGLAIAQVNLRRLFGINARADLLLYLISGRSGSSAGIARAVWFDQKAVYRTLESWAEAGVCTRPRAHSADGYILVRTDEWLQLLNLDQPVSWVNWAENLFPLLLVHHATSTPPWAEDRYLLSSLLRELYDGLTVTGRPWGIRFPDHHSHPGEVLFEPAAMAVLELAGAITGAV